MIILTTILRFYVKNAFSLARFADVKDSSFWSKKNICKKKIETYF